MKKKRKRKDTTQETIEKGEPAQSTSPRTRTMTENDKTKNKNSKTHSKKHNRNWETTPSNETPRKPNKHASKSSSANHIRRKDTHRDKKHRQHAHRKETNGNETRRKETNKQRKVYKIQRFRN